LFIEKLGFITKIGDILKQTMTVSAAKIKAASLPNCRGFSFKGPDNGQPVEIFFKDSSEFKVAGTVYDPYGARYIFPGDWRSFLLEDPGLQDWLVSEPLQPNVWQDISLQKGPRYLSLRVRPSGLPSSHGDAQSERVEWDAAEQSDPFYSEVSSCDTLFIGASKDGVNSVRLSGGWLADALVRVGERQREPRHKPDVDIVRMPLDKVDLQTVAMAFETEIIVDHLMEESWLFSPCPTQRLCRCARLMRYVDLWAAMATPRAFEEEPLPFPGALVELDTQLPGHLRPVSRKAASILGYEHLTDAYKSCVDQVPFLIQRSMISRVIYHDGMLMDMLSEDEGPEQLRQVPTKSIVFFLLGQLVKQLASRRLETCHLVTKGSLPAEAMQQVMFPQVRVQQALGNQQLQIVDAPQPDIPSSSSQQVADGSSGESGSSSHLGAQGFKPAGKDDVPRPRRSASAAASSADAPVAVTTGSASSSSPCAFNEPRNAPLTQPSPHLKRCSLQEVRAEVVAGRPVMISAVRAFTPFAEGQLQIKPLDQVYVVEFRDHWVKCHLTRREEFAAWCPLYCLLIWHVTAAFTPDPSWGQIYHTCLPLAVGLDVVVTQVFEGARKGWGLGRLYSADNPDGEASREGIFLTENLRQDVYVVQWR
jgi:hypothetical protein